MQTDDYFVFDAPLGSSEYIYVFLAKLQTAASSAAKNQAEFLLVPSGDKQWKFHWVKTREAQAEDPKIGTEIIVFDETDANGVYRAPESNQEARSSCWIMTRITDASDLYKGFILGSGGLRISPNSVRVIGK